jgi:calcineurin-like phosphoesterase family protein
MFNFKDDILYYANTLNESFAVNENMFICSDTHFGHSNIIKFTGRPFKTVENMDGRLISNWNKTVKNADTVLFLGDFAAWYIDNNKPKNITIEDVAFSYREKLNGKIFALLGNHDGKLSTASWGKVFDKVATKPFKYKNIIFTHNPMIKLAENEMNIHGHTHEKNVNDPRYFNVSMENIGYKPMLLSVAIKKLKEQNENKELKEKVISSGYPVEQLAR